MTSPAETNQVQLQRWLVLGLLCSLSMVTYLDRVCFGASAKYIVQDLGLRDVTDLKWAFTAFALAYGLFEVPAGWLGDRYGPRGTLIRIVIWWSACTVLTGLVGLKFGTWTLGGLGTLIALRFLFGAGEAGAYPNITRALHNWFPREQWERVQGLVWMSGRLMGGLTPFVWTVLVAGSTNSPGLISWRWAFALFGVIGVVWCLLFMKWFRDQPDQLTPAERYESSTAVSQSPHSLHATPWLAIATSPSLWALCVMYFLLNYGWIFNITYLPSYLQTRFALKPDDYIGAIYQGAPLWVGAAGCLSGGWVANWLSQGIGDRIVARRILGTSALAVCACLWFCALQATNIHVFCMCVAGAAFCIDMTLGISWASCQDLGRQHAAVVAAVMNTVGTMGSALASWLTGSMVENSLAQAAQQLGKTVDTLTALEKTSASNAGFASVFLTYGCVYIVAAFCWLAVNPRGGLVKSDSDS